MLALATSRLLSNNPILLSLFGLIITLTSSLSEPILTLGVLLEMVWSGASSDS